jgi:hypothetical protein
MIITASQKSMATILMESAFAARVSDWANRWEPTAPTFVRRVGKACELSGVTLKGTQIKEHFLKQ